MVVLRALAVFQPYRDLEAGDNQSLKIQVVRSYYKVQIIRSYNILNKIDCKEVNVLCKSLDSRLKFVVDHIAKPYMKDKVIEGWKEEIAAIAEFPNVHCKL